MNRYFLEFIQKNLNRYLALDPETKTRLRALQGKRVTIELRGLKITLQLIFMNEKIEVKCDDFFTPDTIIKGTPLTLLRMSLTHGDRKHFFADDVSIEGCLELGQEVIDLFDQLEIDWEEYASRWVGDVPAHHMGRIARDLKEFSGRVRESLLQNVNEYIHEEINLAPTREALHDFYGDVDSLRMDIDRIEAKIAQLKKKAIQ